MPIQSQNGNNATAIVPGNWGLALGPTSVQNGSTLAPGNTWEVYASYDTQNPIASSSAPNGWAIDIDNPSQGTGRVFVPAGAAWLNRFDFFSSPMYVVITSTFVVYNGINSRVAANIELQPAAPVITAIGVAANGDYLLTFATQAGPNIASCDLCYGGAGATLAAGLSPGQVVTVAVPRAFDGQFSVCQAVNVPSATLHPRMFSVNTNVEPPARFPVAPSNLVRTNSNFAHRPAFSWAFTDPEVGDYQTAYRMVFTQGGTLVFDSGYIASGATAAASDIDLAPGNYLLTLRYKDSHGLESNPKTLAFEQVASVPRVVNFALTGGTPTADRTPTFTWGYQDDAGDAQAHFQLVVQRTDTNATVFDSTKTASAANTVTSTALAAYTSYRALVTVFDSTGVASATSTLLFEVVNAGPVISGLAITGGTPTFDTTPAFTWNYADAEGDAQASYRFVVRRADNSAVVFDTGAVAGTGTAQTVTAPLEVAVTYVASVVATDTQGGVSVPAMLGFTVDDDRPFVSGLAITGGTPTSDTTPEFTWTYTHPLGGTQTWYRLRILLGAAEVYDSGEVASNAARAHTVPALLRGRTYSAVLTVANGRGPVSLSFAIINQAPVVSAFVLVGGTGSNPTTTTDTTPTFTWGFSDADGEGQSAFVLQVLARDRGELVFDSGIVNSAALTFTLPTALEDDDNYRAVLVASDPNGGASAPVQLDFDIPFDETRVILTPIWQAPPHNTSTVPLPFYLFRVPGDVGGPRVLEFEIQVANNLAFTNPITWGKTRRSRLGWSFSGDGGATWGALPPRLAEGNPGGAAGGPTARWLRFQPVVPLPLGYVFVRLRALVM